MIISSSPPSHGRSRKVFFQDGGADGTGAFSRSFTAARAKTPFHPARLTPKPNWRRHSAPFRRHSALTRTKLFLAQRPHRAQLSRRRYRARVDREKLNSFLSATANRKMISTTGSCTSRATITRRNSGAVQGTSASGRWPPTPMIVALRLTQRTTRATTSASSTFSIILQKAQAVRRRQNRSIHIAGKRGQTISRHSLLFLIDDGGRVPARAPFGGDLGKDDRR